MYSCNFILLVKSKPKFHLDTWQLSRFRNKKQISLVIFWNMKLDIIYLVSALLSKPVSYVNYKKLFGLCCDMFILENSLHETAHGTDKWQKPNIPFGLLCPLLFNLNPEVHVHTLIFFSPRTWKNIKSTSKKIAVHRVFTGCTENGNRVFNSLALEMDI